MGRAPASGTAKLSPRMEDTGPKPVLEEQGGPAGDEQAFVCPCGFYLTSGKGVVIW